MEKNTIQLTKEVLAYYDSKEDKPAIILIHGNMSSAVHYSPIIEDLKQEFRVIAVDLRGFGDSSYNEPFNSLKELAADVKELCDALAIEKAAVVGWSAGAGVALEMAVAYPDFVTRLFSIDGVGHMGFPLPKLDENQQPIPGAYYATKEELATQPVSVAPMLGILAAGNAALMSQIWEFTIYTVNKPHPEDNDLWISETMKQRCLLDIDWALANFNLSDQDNGYNQGDNSAGKISCPCAFTIGDKDIVIPGGVITIEATAKAIGDNTKVIVYENCGHSPLVDVKDQLVADILSFCR